MSVFADTDDWINAQGMTGYFAQSLIGWNEPSLFVTLSAISMQTKLKQFMVGLICILQKEKTTSCTDPGAHKGALLKELAASVKCKVTGLEY